MINKNIQNKKIVYHFNYNIYLQKCKNQLDQQMQEDQLDHFNGIHKNHLHNMMYKNFVEFYLMQYNNQMIKILLINFINHTHNHMFNVLNANKKVFKMIYFLIYHLL